MTGENGIITPNENRIDNGCTISNPVWDELSSWWEADTGIPMTVDHLSSLIDERAFREIVENEYTTFTIPKIHTRRGSPSIIGMELICEILQSGNNPDEDQHNLDCAAFVEIHGWKILELWRNGSVNTELSKQARKIMNRKPKDSKTTLFTANLRIFN